VANATQSLGEVNPVARLDLELAWRNWQISDHWYNNVSSLQNKKVEIALKQAYHYVAGKQFVDP